MSLVITKLNVQTENKDILKDLSLIVKPNEVHALMGPNGAGKTTLSYAIFGHPNYKITQGSIYFLDQNILDLETHERARLGLFLAFQNPSTIAGLDIVSFLRASYKAYHGIDITPLAFRRLLNSKLDLLEMDHSFLDRSVNENLSGGEKKRLEILQLAVLEPKFAILDECDSGLDIDALKIVASGIKKLMQAKLGILIITHYIKLLQFIEPDVVHVMLNGTIVKTGGKDLISELELNGYKNFKNPEL